LAEVKTGTKNRNELLLRMYVVMLVFLLFSVAIIWRACKVSVVEGDKWKEKIGKYVKWKDVESERGNIFSADGSLLATSVQFFEIRIDPAAASDVDFRKHVDSLSIYLEKYADTDRNRFEWKLHLIGKRDAWFNKKERGSRNVLLTRKADHDLYRKFRTFPLLKFGANRGGLIVNRFSQRAKPFKELASRTIGVDRLNAGKIGLEGFYDSHLSGDSSKIMMKWLPSSGIWVPLNDLTEIGGRKGSDIKTTIDVSIQDIVHSELLEALKYQNAKQGCAIVMDVKTGAIKAISNLSKMKDGSYAEVYNHAIGELSEPGSTFKLASVMAMLESGKVNKNSIVNLNGGKLKFYDQWMEDSHIHGKQDVTLEKAFTMSSNVGIGRLAMKTFGSKSDRAEFTGLLETFGLRNKTGVKLSGEPVPYIKDPTKDKKIWYGTTVPWMAHGYELMLTPLQILNFYNAVANDGKLMKPYMVQEIWNDLNQKSTYNPEVLDHQIASEKTIEVAKVMLEKVVTEGTAKNIKSDQFNIAGKTGTASVNYTDKDVKKKKHNGSFVGYFPAEDPLYSIIVVLYEPKKDYYGNKVAAPVFKSIAERCFALKSKLQKSLEVKKVTNELPENGKGYARDFAEVFKYAFVNYESKGKESWVELKDVGTKVRMSKDEMKPDVVPDVRGMGVRDAVYVLENMGLAVVLNGSGKVNKQSVLPGTKISEQKIELYLN